MSVKNKINKYLRKFGVELHGVNYLQALAKGDFKKNELDFIQDYYGTKKITIYDVGANRGLMIDEFLSHFPAAAVHAFEPFQQFAEMLTEKHRGNHNITINQTGISNEAGTLTFNVNKSIDTSSFLSSKKTGLNSDAQVETITKVEVPVTTIDSYSQKMNIEKIHLLKLDIQGSELNALKGAQGLLAGKQIDFIFSETYFVQQYENQPSFFDIANYLLPFGYVMQDMYHPIYGNGKLAWCDTLFVREDLKPL